MPANASLIANFVKALDYYKTVSGKRNKEIANAIGIPETTFSSWCKGKHLPDMDRLQTLATYLNAPIDQFFKFSVQKTDPLTKELYDLISELSTEDKQFLRTVALRLIK